MKKTIRFIVRESFMAGFTLGRSTANLEKENEILEKLAADYYENNGTSWDVKKNIND